MKAEGNPIKELRERINVSQRELANALEVHHSYIANLESNLINLDEEGLDEQSKIKEIFEKLAHWSGEDASSLLERQKKCTLESTERIKTLVQGSLAALAIEWVGGGSEKLIGEEIAFFAQELRQRCDEELKSPITVLRESAGITQRNLAIAFDVSQAYIARVEKGELPITGPRTGSKVMISIINSIYDDTDDENGDLFMFIDEQIADCQKRFIETNKRKSKDSVIAAFDKIAKKKE